MARLPLEDQTIVTAFDGGSYGLNAICAAPECLEQTADPHHMWRRSFLGGAFDWVLIRPEGEVGVAVGNVVGLCRAHHDQIEAGSAWITLERGRFCWTTLLSATQELVWQPPVKVPSTEEAPYSENRDANVTNGTDDLDKPPGYEYEVEFRTGSPIPQAIAIDGICPSCKRPLPHPKHEGATEEKRPRRSWTITVPKDERENGAEVLDELLDASREEMAKLGLPYGENDKVRYFVLSAVLALFVQHAHTLMGEGA